MQSSKMPPLVNDNDPRSSSLQSNSLSSGMTRENGASDQGTAMAQRGAVYTGNIVSGAARAHLGNVYTTNNITNIGMCW